MLEGNKPVVGHIVVANLGQAHFKAAVGSRLYGFEWKRYVAVVLSAKRSSDMTPQGVSLRHQYSEPYPR